MELVFGNRKVVNYKRYYLRRDMNYLFIFLGVVCIGFFLALLSGPRSRGLGASRLPPPPPSKNHRLAKRPEITDFGSRPKITPEMVATYNRNQEIAKGTSQFRRSNRDSNRIARLDSTDDVVPGHSFVVNDYSSSHCSSYSSGGDCGGSSGGGDGGGGGGD